MAFVDNPNQGNDQQQVAGSTPLSSGQPTNQPSEAGNAPMSGSSGAAIESGADPSKGVQTVNKGSGKASSGQYTNIQKYVAKNKPQAQQMTQAVTQDIGKQAGAIKSQADQQKAKQDALIKANEQAMSNARTSATNIVGAIAGTGDATNTANLTDDYQKSVLGDKYDQYQTDKTALANKTYDQTGFKKLSAWSADQKALKDTYFSEAPTFEDYQATQYNKLISGDIGQQQVNDLNIAQQQNKANALQQLAGRANTEQGRRDLLGQTFQKQGDYTRGMSGLDQLITGGDQAAREQLIKGTQGQADELNTGLQGLATTAANERLAQQTALGQIGGELEGLVTGETGALTGIEGEIDKAYEDEVKARTALLSPGSPEYIAAVGEAKANLDAKKAQLQGGSYADLIDSLIPQAYQQAQVGSLGDAKSTNLENYASAIREMEETGTVIKRDPYSGNPLLDANNRPITLTGQAATDYIQSGGGVRSGHGKNEQTLISMMNLINQNLGLDKDLYGVNQVDTSTGQSRPSYAQSLGGIQDFYANQYNNMTAEDLIKSKLAGSSQGYTYDQLQKGEDISKEDFMTQDRVNKMNALKKLVGKTDLISEEQLGDQYYANNADLTKLLQGYVK